MLNGTGIRRGITLANAALIVALSGCGISSQPASNTNIEHAINRVSRCDATLFERSCRSFRTAQRSLRAFLKSNPSPTVGELSKATREAKEAQRVADEIAEESERDSKRNATISEFKKNNY